MKNVKSCTVMVDLYTGKDLTQSLVTVEDTLTRSNVGINSRIHQNYDRKVTWNIKRHVRVKTWPS